MFAHSEGGIFTVKGISEERVEQEKKRKLNAKKKILKKNRVKKAKMKFKAHQVLTASSSEIKVVIFCIPGCSTFKYEYFHHLFFMSVVVHWLEYV